MPSLGGRAAPHHRRQRGGHAAVSALSASQLLLSLRKASRHEQVEAGPTGCKLSRAAQRKKTQRGRGRRLVRVHKVQRHARLAAVSALEAPAVRKIKKFYSLRRAAPERNLEVSVPNGAGKR